MNQAAAELAKFADVCGADLMPGPKGHVHGWQYVGGPGLPGHDAVKEAPHTKGALAAVRAANDQKIKSEQTPIKASAKSLESPFAATDLNGHESSVMEDYTNPGYFAMINGLLRRPGKTPVEWDRGDAQRVASDAAVLQGAVARHKTSADTTVYRGLDLDLAEAGPGTKINDRGFMSTSTNRDKAVKFGDYLLEIHVPKGSRALNIGGPEGEVLLSSNSTLEVTGVSKGVVKARLVTA